MSLSILIPAIPERIDAFRALYDKISAQINNRDVEIISIIDNKKRTIGQKRNDLISLASKEYLTMIDDDDDISVSFIEEIFAVMVGNTDVITFLQDAKINNLSTVVNFRLKNENEKFVSNGITQRPAWHCCVWKTSIAKQCYFDNNLNWGEDAPFSVMANQLAQTEYFIPKVLHFYTHNSNKTAAFK